METVVTKGEFARLKGRTPACVSHWITHGKISKAALVGEGVRARIRVEQADADLARTLDPNEQDKQTSPILPPVRTPPHPGEAPTNIADTEILRRKRIADAERAEHDAEAARRRNAVDEGKWIDAVAARREWGRELSKVITDTETFLFNTVAKALADSHGLDWKAVAAEVRQLYRKHRSEATKDATDRRVAAEAALSEAAE